MRAIIETEIKIKNPLDHLTEPCEIIDYICSDVVGTYDSFNKACEALTKLKEEKLASGYWSKVIKESSNSVRLSNGGSYLKELLIITL